MKNTIEPGWLVKNKLHRCMDLDAYLEFHFLLPRNNRSGKLEFIANTDYSVFSVQFNGEAVSWFTVLLHISRWRGFLCWFFFLSYFVDFSNSFPLEVKLNVYRNPILIIKWENLGFYAPVVLLWAIILSSD